MVFYALLLAAPCEWWWRGRPTAPVQLVGLALAVAGVVGYRRSGRALGEQLTPLVAPAEPAALVEAGPYRRIRHPMYLAELAIAAGVPVLLTAYLTLVVSAVFAALVVHRIGVEEKLLGARFAAWADYAARTSRLVPHVY